MIAPTGRAAKVIDDKVLDDRFDKQNITRHATTIHSMIYTYSGFNRSVSDEELTNIDATGQLSLVFSPTQCDPDDKNTTIYIIDESSMISDKPDTLGAQATFGNGRLLQELINYDTRPGSKFIFIGDPCQLPPISDNHSPALSPETFTPKAQVAQLTEIIRQSSDSDIITISKLIRNQIAALPETKAAYGSRKSWGMLPFASASSFIQHPTTDDMIAHYVSNVREKGYNDSIYICNFNKTATTISLNVRQQLLNTTSPHPVAKDLLMVIQNNYTTGLVNGDLVEVVRCSANIRRQAGLHFADITVREIGSGVERRCLILLDTLASSQLNLNPTQQTALFLDFIRRMKEQGIKQKTEAFNNNLHKDPHTSTLCAASMAMQ